MKKEKANKRAILKHLLNGTITGPLAARQLQNNGRSIVHLHIRYRDGTHYYDGKILTEEHFQAKKKSKTPTD